MNSLQKQQHKPNQKFPLRFVRRASWDYGTVVMHEATHFKIGKFLHYTFIKFHYSPFLFFADIVNLYFIEVKRANLTWSPSFYLGKAKINCLYPNKLLSSKGSIISESFSFWLKPPKKVPDHDTEHLFQGGYWSGSWFGSFVLTFEPKWKTS